MNKVIRTAAKAAINAANNPISLAAQTIGKEAVRNAVHPNFSAFVSKVMEEVAKDLKNPTFSAAAFDIGKVVAMDIVKKGRSVQSPDFDVESIITAAMESADIDVKSLNLDAVTGRAAAKFGKDNFKVGFWGVERDASQNLTGNRGKLNHSHILESSRLGNELMTRSQEDDLVVYNGKEDHGARPQVTSVFLGDDFTRASREKREAAPDETVRPLWRGNNAWVLQKIAAQEQEHLIRQLHDDVKFDERASGKADTPLMMKVFDSQANKQEVETTIGIVRKINEELMRAGDTDNLIGIEYGIPYSNGAKHNPNPYTDDFYMGKVQDAIDTFKANEDSIPQHLFRIGLKDMVGELNGPDAARLTGRIIDMCKANDVMLEIDLHCHHTGLATQAYAAAIETAYAKDWPISCDTVEGTEANFSLDGHPSEVGTGFTSSVSVHNLLKERNKGTGNALEAGILNGQQIDIMQRKGQLIDEFLEEYKLRRAEVPQSFYEIIRDVHLAGGAFSSFSQAVDDQAMAVKLGLPSEEALKVSAYALNVAGYLTGQPLSVTPAMLHRQTTCLHLLNNMIADDFFADCNGAEAMIEKLKAISKDKENGDCGLSDEQVQKYFLANIADNPAMGKVMSFLKDPVPGDFIAKDGARGIHPLIVENLKEVKAVETPNRIADIQAKLETFWNDGLLGPDAMQVTKVLRQNGVSSGKIEAIAGLIDLEKRGMGAQGSFAVVKNELEKTGDYSKAIGDELKRVTMNSATSNAIVAGPDVCFRHITHRWNHEPDAALFNGNAAAYGRAIAKSKKGLDPYPQSDAAESIIEGLNSDLNVSLAAARVEREMVKERGEIYNFVNQFIAKETDNIAVVAASDGEALKDAVSNITKAIYEEQSAIITDKLANKGQKFFMHKAERMDVAFDRLSDFLANVLPLEKASVAQLMAETRKEIEGKEMLSEIPGLVNKVFVEAGQEVKKGDVVLQMEAMKMQIPVKATRDGVIESIVEKGVSVAQGAKLIGFSGEVENALEAKPTRPVGVVASEPQKVAVREVLESFSEATKALSKQEIEQVNAVVDACGKEAVSKSKHNKSGYNVGNNLSNIGGIEAITGDNVIHVVGNRAGCASKIIGDLKDYGCKDVRLLHTADDKTTPIAQSLPDGDKQRIANYMDQDEIIGKLKAIRDANPGKKIAFHPGWGFLSEVAEFVAKCEQTEGVVFAGPPSKPMEISGGKKTFRDKVQEAAPELNPPYLGSATVSATGKGAQFSLDELNAYVKDVKGFAGSQIDTVFRAEFAELMRPDGMNGDGVIKAVAGGGGKGIEFFKHDETKSAEENFQQYMTALRGNVEYASNNFANAEMIVEKCIRGKSQHIEVQIAADGKGGSANLGFRNCMIQTAGQKFAEQNITEGDYPEGLITTAINASKNLGEALSRQGYKGVGTLEIMLDPQTNEATILELNTRTQVEHAVTEEGALLKTGKPLSIPVLNAILTVGDVSVDEVLEQQFNFTAQDRKALEGVDKERVLHYRINAKTLDLEKGGKAKPTDFHDALWNSEVSSNIAEKYGVRLMQGGKGGNYDSQIGAIWGKESDVLAATAELSDYFKVMERLDRSAAVTNLGNISYISNAMLNEQGKFRKDVATATIDEFMKDKEAGFKGSLVDYIDGRTIANENKAPSGSVKARGEVVSLVGRDGRDDGSVQQG